MQTPRRYRSGGSNVGATKYEMRAAFCRLHGHYQQSRRLVVQIQGADNYSKQRLIARLTVTQALRARLEWWLSDELSFGSRSHGFEKAIGVALQAALPVAVQWNVALSRQFSVLAPSATLPESICAPAPWPSRHQTGQSPH